MSLSPQNASASEGLPPGVHQDAPFHLATPDDQPAGKRFEVDCDLGYLLHGECDFVFQLHALDGVGQRLLSESLEVFPPLPTHVYRDPSVGHRFLRVHAGAGELNVRYRATVLRLPEPDPRDLNEMPLAELPDEVIHNLMPTRYCESDLLSRVAQKLFGQATPGYARVQAVADWVFEHLDYLPGTTDSRTTARDVFLHRVGVCRDYAHLCVSFCRALNIPARLVVGYARFDTPPPDFHAVFEAYLGGRWVMFDATRMSPTQELIRTGMGRDAKDVAFATIFGPAQMTRILPELYLSS